MMLKKIVIAGLISSQTLAAQPAFAATLDPAATQGQRPGTGAFGGARVRLQLGGAKARASAGLALAPMQHSRVGSAIGFRTGEGIEFGFTGRSQRPTLSLAGRPLSKVARAAQGEEESDKRGISPVVLILGGVVVAGALAYVITKNALDCDSGCE